TSPVSNENNVNFKYGPLKFSEHKAFSLFISSFICFYVYRFSMKMYMERSGYKSIGIKLNCLLLLLVLARLQQPRLVTIIIARLSIYIKYGKMGMYSIGSKLLFLKKEFCEMVFMLTSGQPHTGRKSNANIKMFHKTTTLIRKRRSGVLEQKETSFRSG
ncbi:hypothetical protein M8C21_001983, partial [Ambrosia artemisiifolia]